MSKADLATERKAQIITATIDCIIRYGYHNFSMQDVARVADVSKGIIHYYFLNKEDLMMAVLEKVAGEIENLLATIREQTTDPREQIKQIMRLCFNIVKQKREYYQVNIDFWTQINQKEAVRAAIALHYSKFRTAAANIVQQGIDQGVFQTRDASAMASLIIAIVDGASLQWLFDEKVFDYDNMIKLSEEVILKALIK